METPIIETLLKELGQSGCYGNSEDFLAWTQAYSNSAVHSDEFIKIFNSLVQSGEIVESNKTSSIYKFKTSKTYEKYIEYTASSLYEHFPIQFARSRLESFLSFHNIDNDTVDLILIGATEGFENAVKYNSKNYFKVKYWIDKKVFHLVVENEMKYVSVEENIAAGKFDSSTTLMRGMLVMTKVFDSMDLDFSENKNYAVLRITKNL